MAGTEGADNLRAAYDQLCSSYRAIDEFRPNLLGFLPLVTGGGLILLTGRTEEIRREFFWPVGLFGIAVTTGLLAYELFCIKKCHALIVAGEDLEKEMGLPTDAAGKPAGQFARRPPHLLWIVNEPFAAAAIYPAVLAAWTYLALYFRNAQWREEPSLIVFFVGFAGILLYDQSLKPKSLVRRLLSSFPPRAGRRL